MTCFFSPEFFLVIDTEKGFAFFTTFLVLIDKFVQSIEIWRSGAVHIVPPITNEVLLIENCAIRTQKWVVIAIRLTHVKDLKKIKKGLFLFFYFFFFGESWQHCLQINRICGLSVFRTQCYLVHLFSEKCHGIFILKISTRKTLGWLNVPIW